MKKHIHIILFVAVLLQACAKQEEPADNIATPVFSMSGMIGDRPVTLIAGEQDFYMYPDYGYDNGVNIFIGDLRRDCPGCKTSLRLLVRDNRLSAAGVPVIAEESILDKEYLFSGDKNNVIYTVTYVAAATGSGTRSNSWSFSDGTSYTQDSVVKKVVPPMAIDVLYNSSFSGGCSSSIGYPMRFRRTADPGVLPEISYFSIDTSVKNQFSFSAIGNNSSAYLWDFGEGVRIGGQSVNYTYNDTSSGVRTVTLTEFTSNGDTNIVRRNLAVRNYDDCISNFVVKRTLEPDPHELSTVVVEWTDENGIKYTSKGTRQDETGKVRILNGARYIDNLGRKTWAFDVLINCQVSDGTTVIRLSNLSGRMAVAYP